MPVSQETMESDLGSKVKAGKRRRKKKQRRRERKRKKRQTDIDTHKL